MPDAATITNLLTGASFLVFITVYIVNSRGAARMLGERLRGMDHTITNFAIELKKLQDVVTAQAVQSTRIDNLSQTLLETGKRVDGSSANVQRMLMKLAAVPVSDDR